VQLRKLVTFDAGSHHFASIALHSALIGCLSLSLAGCVSKAKARAEAKAAFLAGQQQAMARMQQTRGAVVTILGPVTNPNIPWTQDLTVAKAIVDAGYTGANDPTHIVIVRNGQAITIDPKKLLSGEDVPLQAGDFIQLTP
jgi:protein involved in polysaccharide export with SLBB domain